MAKDPYWSSTVLAMHMDDSNLLDLKGKTVSFVGGAARSATQSKFGGYSAYFDGNGDYLTVPDSADFSLGNTFTIECWFYAPAQANNTWDVGPLFSHSSNAAQGEQFFGLSMSGALVFNNYTGGSYKQVYSGVCTYNQWNHAALSCLNGVATVYLNGVGGAPVVISTWVDHSLPPAIGANVLPSYGIADYFVGYIDDLRVTKGVARYLSNFTPPTEPFPNGPYEVGGTILDANNSPVSRTIRVYDRVTGALAGTDQSSPVTGIYNVVINTANEVQVVMLDDVLGTTENDQILRTTPV